MCTTCHTKVRYNESSLVFKIKHILPEHHFLFIVNLINGANIYRHNVQLKRAFIYNLYL